MKEKPFFWNSKVFLMIFPLSFKPLALYYSYGSKKSFHLISFRYLNSVFLFSSNTHRNISQLHSAMPKYEKKDYFSLYNNTYQWLPLVNWSDEKIIFTEWSTWYANTCSSIDMDFFLIATLSLYSLCISYSRYQFTLWKKISISPTI